jgi:HAD superfamily hydrolase (TIGR01509 family)
MIRAVFIESEAVFTREGSLRGGAEAFIRECANRFPAILLTNGPRPEAQAVLRAAHVDSLFLDILTAAEVDQLKPEPDLLIAALGRIGFLLRDRNPIEPRECLLIECSHDGIEAAHRAGMHSLAIAAQHLPDTEFCFRNFAEVDLDFVLRRCAESSRRA